MGVFRTMVSGIPTLYSRITDAAGAVAERVLWRALVAAPTNGATLFRAVWEDNAAALRTAFQLRRTTSGWIADFIRDNGGVVSLDYVAGVLNMGTLGLQVSAAGIIELFTAGATSITLFATDVSYGNAATHRVPASFNMVNRTGTPVAIGDVLSLSLANDDSVVEHTGAGDTRVLIAATAGANLATIKVVEGAKGTVLCSTALVTRGDPLQSSATARQAQTSAVPTLGIVFGIAITGKAAGATGQVPYIAFRR